MFGGLFRKRPSVVIDNGDADEFFDPFAVSPGLVAANEAVNEAMNDSETELVGAPSVVAANAVDSEPSPLIAPEPLQKEQAGADIAKVVASELSMTEQPDVFEHTNHQVPDDASDMMVDGAAVTVSAVPRIELTDETDAVFDSDGADLPVSDAVFVPKRVRHGKILPFGIDLTNNGFSIVVGQLVGKELHIELAEWVEIPDMLTGYNRVVAVRRAVAAIEESLRSLHTTKGIVISRKQRFCVLAVPGNEVVAQKFQPSKKLSTADLRGLAMVKSESLVKYAANERAVALERHGSEEALVVTRRNVVHARAEFARAIGLRVIGVDVDWCSWQRSLPDIDAVVDIRDPLMPLLSVFGQKVGGVDEPGCTYSLPASLSLDQTVLRIGHAFLDLLKDRGFVVETLAVAGWGDERMHNLLDALRNLDGVQSLPVSIGGNNSTSSLWGLALGLMQWSLEELGIAV